MKTRTLQTVKDEVAKKHFYTDWKHLDGAAIPQDIENKYWPEVVRECVLASLESKFCTCDSEIKTGWTSAKHCNMCGKLEPDETWLK